MIRNIKRLIGLSVMSALSTTISSEVSAQETESPKYDYAKWNVSNPPFALNEVTINTTETTWSSLDIAPNGKYMVFDMLGDIYKVNVDGGDATPITQDFAWNIHPSISPDGSKIAFISDRDGINNLWIMDSNGENLRQVTKEKNNLIHSPKWSPDGEYLLVSKGIMSSRSIPAGEIWMYHNTGLSLIHI